MDLKTLSEQEQQVLKFLARNGSTTVREVAECLGYDRAVAETVVWRLRKVHQLVMRTGEPRQYRYQALVSPTDAQARLVRNFVTSRLGGAFSPVVSCLCQEVELSDDERLVLQRLLVRLEEQDQDRQP